MKIKRRLITIGRSGNGDYIAEVHRYFHEIKHRRHKEKQIKAILRAIIAELT